MANEKLVRIKNRADSTENWDKNNPTLQFGELGIAYDNWFIDPTTNEIKSAGFPKAKIGRNDTWSNCSYVLGSCISRPNGADSFNNINLKDYTSGIGLINYARGKVSHAEGLGTHAGGTINPLTYTNTAGVYTAVGNYKSETSLYLYKDDKFLAIAKLSSATYDSTTKKTTFTFETKYTDTKLYFLSSSNVNNNITHSNDTQPMDYGTASHSEGIGTIAFGNAQHAEGRYNVIDYKGKYAHITGIGSDDGSNYRCNGFAVDWDGNGYFKGDIYKFNGDKKNDSSQPIKLVNIGMPVCSMGVPDEPTIGQFIHIPIYMDKQIIYGASFTKIETTTGKRLLSNNDIIYPGTKFTLNNIEYTVVEAKYYEMGMLIREYIVDKDFTETISNRTVTLIDNNITINPGDDLLYTPCGWKKIDIEYSKASNTEVIDNLTSTDTDKALSANQGKLLNDKIDGIPISLINNSIKIGSNEFVSSSGNNSIVSGKYVSANGDYSTAIGYDLHSIGNYSHSEGFGTWAGSYAFKITKISVSGSTSVLTLEDYGVMYIGSKCFIRTSSAVDNVNIISIDSTNKTITVDCKVDALSTTSTDDNAENYVIIGDSNSSGEFNIGISAHAEGYESRAYAPWSHAEGKGTIAGGQYSHAEGRETIAGYASHAEGRGTEASGNMSHSEGSGSKATGRISHAEGNLTNATGTHSHSEGSGTIASGENSHAQGAQTEATEYASHASGENSKATGRGSHSEGYLTEASGKYSHTEGSNTTSSGESAHSEGRESAASGTNSHAEGFATKAIGVNSHAEGNSTESSGVGSHTEGTSSIAKGDTTHAEGFQTEASGMYTHAEGHLTKVSGYASHVEGSRCESTGSYTHVEGLSNKSTKDYQHIQGRFSVLDTTGKYAHIVGNGNDSLRSNAHTLDWSGNSWYAGTIKIGGSSYDDANSKEVATKDYVDNKASSVLWEDIGAKSINVSLTNIKLANANTNGNYCKIIDNNNIELIDDNFDIFNYAKFRYVLQKGTIINTISTYSATESEYTGNEAYKASWPCIAIGTSYDSDKQKVTDSFFNFLGKSAVSSDTPYTTEYELEKDIICLVDPKYIYCKNTTMGYMFPTEVTSGVNFYESAEDYSSSFKYAIQLSDNTKTGLKMSVTIDGTLKLQGLRVIK